MAHIYREYKMRMLMNSATASHHTLFPNPLHVSELRALPQYRIGNDAILKGESLEEFFRIQELLKGLAPTDEDDARTLWIESLRGDPSEWGNYSLMLEEKIVSSHEDYMEQWRLYNPEEVVWWRVTTLAYKDRHSLIITDGENSYSLLTNGKNPSDFHPEEEPEESYYPEVAKTLRRLCGYLLLVVDSIKKDPDEYNAYVDTHLPRRFRTGKLPLREYRRLTGDDPCKGLTEEDVAFLERKALEIEKDWLTERPMTLGLYARAWIIGYKALYAHYPDRVGRISKDDLEAFRIHSLCGNDVLCYDADNAEDFDSWVKGARPAHGCEYLSGGLALYPEKARDGSLLTLYSSEEEDILKVLRVARSLEMADIRFFLKGAADMLRFVRGDGMFTFDPRGTAGYFNPRHRFPSRPTEDMPQEVINALDKTTDWDPLIRVRPMSEILQMQLPKKKKPISRKKVNPSSFFNIAWKAAMNHMMEDLKADPKTEE